MSGPASPIEKGAIACILAEWFGCGTSYPVLQSTTPVLLCTTQYYSILQSTTPLLLCTTPALLRTIPAAAPAPAPAPAPAARAGPARKVCSDR